MRKPRNHRLKRGITVVRIIKLTITIANIQSSGRVRNIFVEFHINNLAQIKKDTLAIGDGEVGVRRICAGGLIIKINFHGRVGAVPLHVVIIALKSLLEAGIHY